MTSVDPYSSNPFRVLGLRSTASEKEIGRSADRLLKWIELNESPQIPDLLPHLGSLRRDRDEIKNAVKEIEDPRSRIHFELFWPSCEFSGFDTCQELLTAGQYSEFVAICEKAIANGEAEEENTECRIDACLACQFLAVFYHSAATAALRREKAAASDGNPPADWTQALRYWNFLMKDEVFWERLARRAKLLEDPRVNAAYVEELRQDLPAALLRVNVSRAVASAERDQFEEMAFHCWIIQNAQLGPAADKALKGIVATLRPRFETALPEINTSLEDKAIKRDVPVIASPAGGAETTYDLQKLIQYLSAVEAEVNSKVIPAAQAIQRAGLSDTQLASEILDAVAYTYRGISLAFANHGRMPRESLRLTAAAREFATSAQCKARLDEDYAVLQLLALKKEASDLAAESRYKESMAKFEEARQYATAAEERRDLEEWIKATRERLPLEGLRPITSAPRMFTFNGIGTKLYGSRDRDSHTSTYVATLYFTFLFLPILPLAAYRVRRLMYEPGPSRAAGETQYQFFGKAPLKWSAFLGPAIVALVIAALIITSKENSNPAGNTSDSGQAGFSSTSGTSSTGQQPYENRSSQRQRLDKEQTRLDREENELAYERTQIDIQRPSLTFTQNQAELRKFNELVRAYNARLQKYRADVETFNSQINLYNLRR